MTDSTSVPGANPARKLTQTERRALQEAEARRAKIDADTAARPAEQGGPRGAEPTRYGDWEKDGVTSDF